MATFLKIIYPDLKVGWVDFFTIPASGAPINEVYKVQNVVDGCVILDYRRKLIAVDS